MKGMMNFLERAGLVTIDPVEQAAPTSEVSAEPSVPGVPESAISPPPPAADTPLLPGTPLNLEAIYHQAAIAPSLYPAERLLRLLDGLSAMDEATRRLAVAAMDGADDSWSIDDPLADAAAKMAALADHSRHIQAALLSTQGQTQSRIDTITERQEKVVGDIRKQIGELEALMERELQRAATDAAQERAELKKAQDQVAWELSEISLLTQRFQALSTQFSPSNPTPKE